MKISPIHVDNLSGLEYTLVGRRSVIICPEELFLNIPQTDFPSLIKVSVRLFGGKLALLCLDFFPNFFFFSKNFIFKQLKSPAELSLDFFSGFIMNKLISIQN